MAGGRSWVFVYVTGGASVVKLVDVTVKVEVVVMVVFAFA
jgi:hypothetical protein